MRNLIAATILLASFHVASYGALLPSDVQAVKDHILKTDIPELFDTRNYRAKVSNIITDDLDGDGRNEVIVHTIPYYQQSATILIYQVIGGQVKRITEGLAPGLLHKVSGSKLDTHGLGMAFDILPLDSKTGQLKSIDDLFKAAHKTGIGALVTYKPFHHMDTRKGPVYYLDMRHFDSIPGKPETCEGFQFSEVIEILVGDCGKQKNVTVHGVKTASSPKTKRQPLQSARTWE